MSENIGWWDCFFRVVGGLTLMSMLFWMGDPGRWFGLVGLVPLGTALFRWCPVYRAFGLCTRNEVKDWIST
jgi:hypothetical protein